MVLKKEMERLQNEQKGLLDEKDIRIQTLIGQTEKLQADLVKSKHTQNSSVVQVKNEDTGKVIELQQ